MGEPVDLVADAAAAVYLDERNPFRSRLSEDMFAGLAPWLDKLPGRLLHANILGCGVFAAVSGSSAATVATIGRMSIPELRKRGYSDKSILGTLAGSGTLGLLIPPSIILIVYGVSAELSIARLFIAGILPGLMLVVLFTGFVGVRGHDRQGGHAARHGDLSPQSVFRRSPTSSGPRVEAFDPPSSCKG